MKPAALLVVVAFLTQVTATAAQPAPPTPRVVRHVLANGLTVLVRENPAAAVVAVSLQIRAGSGSETTETSGITNFLQRAMLRGTTRYGARELIEAAQDLGGGVDASGDVEYAEIRASGLARHWDRLLELVAEVALAPTLPAEEIERERRLILSQIQTREDNPFPYALETVISDLYGPHPYGLPVLGRRASVAGLSRDALLAHYRGIYRPNRMVIAVSGQVDAARVTRLLDRLFGRVAPATGAGANTAPAAASTGQRRVLERPAQQAQILVGYLAPRLADPDYAAAKVLSAVLGGGMSGRLFVELRDNRGLAYSLGTLNPSRTGPGYLLSYLGTARENVDAAEAGMLHEIARIRADEVTPAELERAKAYILGNLEMDRRTNGRQAWYLAYFELLGAGWDFPDPYARAIAAVTAADVQRAAQRYLTRPTIVVLRPR